MFENLWGIVLVSNSIIIDIHKNTYIINILTLRHTTEHNKCTTCNYCSTGSATDLIRSSANFIYNCFTNMSEIAVYKWDMYHVTLYLQSLVVDFHPIY